MKMSEIFNETGKEELEKKIESIKPNGCIAKYVEYVSEANSTDKSLEGQFMYALYMKDNDFIKKQLKTYYQNLDKSKLIEKLINYETDDAPYTYESMQENCDYDCIEEMLLDKISEESFCESLKNHMKEVLQTIVDNMKLTKQEQRSNDLKEKIQRYKTNLKLNEDLIKSCEEELQKILNS